MSALPELKPRSLTWGRGKKRSAHARFGPDRHPRVFADPNSPSRRGTNENTNGLLRQCPLEERVCPARPLATSPQPAATGSAKTAAG
jgi:hypothetical protein